MIEANVINTNCQSNKKLKAELREIRYRRAVLWIVPVIVRREALCKGSNAVKEIFFPQSEAYELEYSPVIRQIGLVEELVEIFM